MIREPHYPDAPALGVMLSSQAQRLGDRPFITLPDGTFSYRQMDADSQRFAATLRDLGYGQGDVVAVLCGNSSPLVVVWGACSHIGAVFMPVNTLLDGAFLAAVLAHSQARIAICDQERYDALAAIQAQIPHLERIVVAHWPTRLRQPAGALSYERLLATPGRSALPLPLPRSGPGKLLYTSGTTGQPKGVLWSRACESTWARAYASELLSVHEGDGLYTCLPLTHVTGQGTVLAALWNGAHVTVDGGFDPFRFWARTRAANARACTCVGTILSVLARRPPRANDADTPVERIIGAAAPVASWRAIERRFGLTIVETWGQTETASCWTAPVHLPQEPGTVGRASARFEARLVDEAGTEVGDDQVGELWIRPRYPHVMCAGYLNDEARTVWMPDGWYRTGDLLSRTRAGDFAFHGRLREAIRRRGELISARAIEEAALSIAGVGEAAAVGVSAPDGVEEEVKLCLVPIDGAVLHPEEIAAALVPLLPAFMRPRYIHVREQLPKTASSRVRKFLLSQEGTTVSWSRRG